MGRLIVLEGLDGCGKSTQLQRLDEYLESTGKPYRQISFPDYGQPSSALVREYLAGSYGSKPGDVNAYAASSFYAVDRYASFKQFWQKDYEADTFILAARYVTSNGIYQTAKLPRSEWEAYLSWLEDYEYDRLGLPRPDEVLFLDLPMDLSKRLIMSRYQGDASRQDVHERDDEFMRNCHEAARFIAARQGWTMIPCSKNGEIRPIDDITADLIACVERRL
ncbi:MAG: deoxynucleoside kinase [Clostridia bacterium]|nr:deoxynucleoside kinase [Clostridia bacterium]